VLPALLFLGTLLAACTVPASPGAPAPSAPAATAPSPAVQPPPLETVRVAHVPSTLFAPLYVAIEKGYFQEQGIAPQLEVVAAGQDAMVLAAQGQLDVVVGGFAAATFNAIARGLEIRAVGSLGTQPQAGYPSALMVRKDLLTSGEVQTVADLRGRKVALAGGAGSTGSYWVATKLREAGLSLRDIEIVNMPFPDMVAAFRSGAIDAAFPPAPFTTEILRDGTADIFGGPIRPGASAVGILYGAHFMEERDAVARRFFLALVRAARDLQGDGYYRDEHLRAYAKYTNLALEVLRQIDRYDFHPDLRPDTETLMDMQRVFLEAGILAFSAPLPPERVADETYSRAAVAQLGPYRP
jgi:NitT/TauT family transport system substrate-binding protein